MTDTTIETRYFHRVEQSKIPLIEAAVAKLAKTAEKVGAPIPELTWGEKSVYKFVDELGISREVPTIGYMVSDTTPRFEGWTLVAAIDHLDGVNIVKFTRMAETDEETNERFFTMASRCDHCKTDRDRRSTFIFRHEDGRETQVGSTCLKDFSGHSLPFFTITADLPQDFNEDEYTPRAKPREFYRVLELVQVAQMCINRYGYTRSTESFSTKHQMLLLTAGDKDMQKDVKPLSDEDKERTIAAIEWIRNSDSTNDYMWNLRSIVAAEATDKRYWGFIASIPQAYTRHLEGEATREVKEEIPAAPVVTGDAVAITGTVLSVALKDNPYDAYATRTVMTVLDDRGFKVWGTKPAKLACDAGDRVSFTAEITVSDRDETFGFFKRPKQAKLLAEVEAA